MSAWGQSRRFGREPITSGPPRRTDISGVCRHVSNVPLAEAMLIAEFVCLRRAFSVARKRVETGPA
jgi:hypothetical protein